MKNLLMTKSSDCKSDLVKGHDSRLYKSAGKHLLLINWRVTSSEATRRGVNSLLSVLRDSIPSH